MGLPVAVNSGFILERIPGKQVQDSGSSHRPDCRQIPTPTEFDSDLLDLECFQFLRRRDA
jgi:hypothetical protein